MESKRFNAGPGEVSWPDPGAETGICGLRSLGGGARGSSRFFPAIGDLAACPHAAGAFAGRQAAAAARERYILAMPA